MESRRVPPTLSDITALGPDAAVTSTDLRDARVVCSLATIRKLEREGVLPPARRLPNGQKWWLRKELARLLGDRQVA